MCGIQSYCSTRQSSYAHEAGWSVQIHQIAFGAVDLPIGWEKRVGIVVRAERLHHPIIGGEGPCTMRTADWWRVGKPRIRLVPVVLEDFAADRREVGLIPVPEKATAGSFNKAGCNLSLDARASAADHLVEDKDNSTHVNRVL